MPVDLKDFALERAILELRFPDRPLIWDHVGSVWQDIFDHYPKAAVRGSDTTQLSVQLSEQITGSISMNRAHLLVNEPGTNIENLRNLADLVLPALIERMKVNVFTRIGLRVLFERPFKTRGDAAAYVLSKGTFPKIQGKLFNIEGQIAEPELAFRWEGEKVGCVVKFKAQTQKLNVEVPYDFRSAKAAIETERHQGLVDVDYYTAADTPAEMVRISDLLLGWLKTVKRDVGGAV